MRTVTDLKADEVEVNVDGAAQKIGTFIGPGEAAPLTFELLLDVSGSRAENELPGLEQKYALGFFTGLLRKGDRAYVREFAVSNRVLASASADPRVLAEAVSQESPPHGRTALLQAVYDACTEDLANGEGRKAILLITDGNENQSKVSRNEIERCLSQESVAVYAVTIPPSIRGRILVPGGGDVYGPDLLNGLARHTGGNMWAVLDEESLVEALGSAVNQIRAQYTIKFTGPGPKPNGKPHKIELKTSRKAITLFAPENMPDGEPIGP